MRYCSLCGKYVKTGEGPFFRVPKDEYRKAKWNAICQKKFTKRALICWEHFNSAQIIRAGRRSLLMPSAVPVFPSLNQKPFVDRCQSYLPEKHAKVTASQNTVCKDKKRDFTQNEFNFNNDVMLQEEPLMKIPIISSIYCAGSTQTNMRLCGSVQVSDFADEFRFNCFYCSEVFPLEKWRKFVTHLKRRHFAKEEAFKIPKYVSEDHDYTAIGSPTSTPTDLALEKVVINAKSLLPFLADPLEPTHSSFESVSFSPVSYYKPDENEEVSNNVHFIKANSSSISTTISAVTNQLSSSQKETEISALSHSLESVNKKSSEKSISRSKPKLMLLRDSDQQTSKSTNKSTNSEVITPENEEECKEDVQQKPTEITFEYTPSAIVDSLLDSMKNYPVLWQFDDEPFNEDFYEAVEDLCKIINDKWSLNIDNLKMRRSINRILRFYCYLYPNENVENIHQFTNYYDKCASFLPSSVNNVTYARCSHCYLCYKHDFNLKPHLLEEQKYLQWPYKCVQCKECFRESDEYEFHKSLPHYDEIFRCETCNKRFVRRNIYNRHVSVYHPKDDNERRKYKCNVCGKAYKTSTSLYAHKIVHGERKHKCHLCPKSFFVNSRLMIHLKSHRKEYDLMCEVCGKGFILHSNLKEHMKKHTGAKVTCNICDLKLRKSSLSRHMRLVHSENDERIVNGKKLRRRKKYHYRSLIKTNFIRKVKETERRKYRCKICNISFERYKLIVEHNKEFHSDTPKWPCKMCTTVFSGKINLKRHYRTKHNFHVIQSFKLVDENVDLNEVLAMKAEDFDEIADIDIRLQNNQTSMTKTPIIKEELLSGEIYFEEEKIDSSAIQDEIMKADDIVTQGIKIDYMNDFFTNLITDHEKNV